MSTHAANDERGDGFSLQPVETSYDLPEPCRQTSDNGITVIEAKVFDENSLRIKLEQTQEQLQKIQAINPSTVTGAIGNIQGQRESDQALSLSVSTLPGVILGRQNRPPASDETAPTIPSAPAQLGSPAASPTLGLSAENMLAKQMALSSDVINLQLLLEGSLTDRIFNRPIQGGKAFSQRAQTVAGFRISIDTKPQYKNAVAEVEIAIVSPTGEAPSLMALIPKDKTYNVATITKKSKVFNAGAVVQLLSIGGSVSSSKADTFLVQDTDTVALEKDRLHVEPRFGDCNPGGAAATFGWQFRPVLDRQAVETGFRQVYAMLSLPIADSFGNSFDGKVVVNTHWRRYNNKSGTVGEIIKNSGNTKVILPLSTLAGDFSAAVLGPRVDQVKWTPADNGQVLVEVRGVNFLSGTKITFGDKQLDSSNGLVIQNEHLMVFKMTGEQLGLNDYGLVVGRYGAPAALRNRPKHPGHRIVSADSVKVEAVDSQTSRVTLRVQELRSTETQPQDGTASFTYQPIVNIGDKVFGMPNNLRVKQLASAPIANNFRTVSTNGNGNGSSDTQSLNQVTLDLTFDAPTSLLRANAGIVTVKDVFFGEDFTREVALNLGSEDFTATEFVVLSSSGKFASFAIKGTNFSRGKIITVFAGGEEFSTADNTLKVLSPTLLSFKTTPEKLKGVKNILITQQDSAQRSGASVVLALPGPVALPKPVITKADPVSEGDVISITLTGSNLNSIGSGEFQGADLSAKPADDGKTMTLDLPAILVSKAGKKDLHFVLKNGGDFAYTLNVEKN
jgi:hypothetical protein